MGALPLLNLVFGVVVLLAIVLAFAPPPVLLAFTFLSFALALGLGSGAVFKLVPTYFPAETGAVTGLVGALGGLGGFFPPIVMGIVRDVTGSYAIALMLLSEFALACLFVLQGSGALLNRQRARAANSELGDLSTPTTS
jgi:NNP family nitrate/nitrite transporter-like MFS transporter